MPLSTLFDVKNYDIVSDAEENDAREFTVAIRQQAIKDVQRIIKVMNESRKSDFDFNKFESSMNGIAKIDTSISARMEINLEQIHFRRFLPNFFGSIFGQKVIILGDNRLNFDPT